MGWGRGCLGTTVGRWSGYKPLLAGDMDGSCEAKEGSSGWVDGRGERRLN